MLDTVKSRYGHRDFAMYNKYTQLCPLESRADCYCLEVDYRRGQHRQSSSRARWCATGSPPLGGGSGSSSSRRPASAGWRPWGAGPGAICHLAHFRFVAPGCGDPRNCAQTGWPKWVPAITYPRLIQLWRSNFVNIESTLKMLLSNMCKVGSTVESYPA